MSPAHVQPFHALEERTEFLVDDGHGMRQRIGILFAQPVEVQAVQPLKLVPVEMAQRNAQPGN